jgi:hypothetical protein
MCKRAKVAIAIATLSLGVFLWLLLEYVGNEEEYQVHYDEWWNDPRLNKVLTEQHLINAWEKMK